MFFDMVEKHDFKVIYPCNCPFLERLKCLEDPPDCLYYYGSLPEKTDNKIKTGRFPFEIGRKKVVAIVGARKMTPYGESWAFKIAKELAELGVIVVSGLATGIDAAAHRGALAGGGQTIAFLGTPIDKIYPSENLGLFEQILEQDGAVFSEYGVGAKIYPKTAFLHRNRLISGVADAVIVVEADVKSGSLNTAVHALSQGVPLFAVPGDLNRQMSRGCNGLFSKGAAAYTAVEDVLNVLFPGGIRTKKREKAELFGSTPDETAVLKLLSSGITSGEEILLRISESDPGFCISRFNTAITMLEIKGVVKREFANNWLLC